MSRSSTTTSVPLRSADPVGAGLALIALALPTAAQVRKDPQVLELIPGLICAPPEAGRRDAPDTASGWVHVPDEPVGIVAEGQRVPAVLGMGFGVWFRLDGFGPLELRHVVTHPPMADTGITRQSWDSRSQGGMEDAIFFQFDVPEELVTGTWTFSAHDGTTELFSVPFTIVEPSEAPDLARLCRDGTMLSMVLPAPGR